ncbi:MAG: outer membrane beta-barrel protein [Candidatus Krumholzibacteriota bacterium]|nr:outer membrane beta-barrel protein [Candidatus Krumholzibacteriota bacterium]
MNTRSIVTGIGAAMFLFAAATTPAYGQATAGGAVSGRSVFHIGGSFSKATVDNAESGFFGVGFFGGKMITHNICLGVSAGYDIVSYNKSDNGNYERLGIIPVQIKAVYFLRLNEMMQLYAAAGGGFYRVVPHLGVEPVGDIHTTETRPGGSVTIGFDYWFLLTSGIGFALEYHAFPPDDGDLFTYYAARVDYTLVRF